MSLLKKTTSRKVKNAEPVSSKRQRSTKASKTPKRVLATLGAAFVLGGSIFGFAACGPKDKVEVVPDEQTNSQQATFNELQQQLEQLQNEMNGLKQDVSKLKENDAALLQLITSNMTIVQNLISDLQKQITSISSQVSANQQDIENLKQSQKEIASQLSTLQANMEAFASQLETLKGQTTDKTDSKTIKDLQQSVAAMQTQINKLTLQNAINYTFTTGYNKVFECHYAAGTGESTSAGYYYTNPNGDYLMEMDLKGLGKQRAFYTNGLYFLRDYNDEEEVHARNTTRFTDVFNELIKDVPYLVADDNAYTFQQDKDKTTFYLSDDGNISQIKNTSNGAVNYYYNFTPFSQKSYDRSYGNITPYIFTYGYYQDLNAAFDKSFDYRYATISGTISTSDGGTGEAKAIYGRNMFGSNYTFTEQNVSRTVINIGGDGVDKSVIQKDGEISESFYDSESDNFKLIGYEFKFGLFDNTFKIEYDSKTDSYTVTSIDDFENSKLVFTAKLEEDGKFSAFETEQSFTFEDGIYVQTTNYQIKGITKAAFEKAFAEIKAQYDELLAKKNENENKAGV